MACYEIRFPTNVSYGAVGGAGWSTRVTGSDGGYTMQQAMWSVPRGRWTISHELRTPEEWHELIAFHRIMMGKLHGFRFQDWSDYTVDTGAGGLAQGSDTALQLYKAYRVTDDASGITQESQRIIVKPQPYTVTIYYDGTAMDPQPAIDYTTGLVTVAPPASGHGYAWTGNFDVPVRFDIDMPELTYENYNNVAWRGIQIVELLPKDLA